MSASGWISNENVGLCWRSSINVNWVVCLKCLLRLTWLATDDDRRVALRPRRLSICQIPLSVDDYGGHSRNDTGQTEAISRVARASSSTPPGRWSLEHWQLLSTGTGTGWLPRASTDVCQSVCLSRAKGAEVEKEAALFWLMLTCVVQRELANDDEVSSLLA